MLAPFTSRGSILLSGFNWEVIKGRTCMQFLGAGEFKPWSCNCSPSQPVYPAALCAQECRRGAQNSKKHARRASTYGANALHLYQWVASWPLCVSSNFCWCNWAWVLTHWFVVKWHAHWCLQERLGWSFWVLISYQTSLPLHLLFCYF